MKNFKKYSILLIAVLVLFVVLLRDENHHISALDYMYNINKDNVGHGIEVRRRALMHNDDDNGAFEETFNGGSFDDHPYPNIDPSLKYKKTITPKGGPHIRKIIHPELVEQFLPKYADPDRYFIYYCHGMCGGLADRQKGMVAGYLFSLLTNRTFGINITQPCKLTEFYRPNLVNWDVQPEDIVNKTLKKHRVGFEVQSKIHKQKLDKYFEEEVILFQTNIDYVTAIRKHPLASKVLPAMMFLQNPDVYSIVLHILLKLAPKVQTQLDNIFENKIGNKHLVCAHVRMGTNPTMRDVSRKLKPEDTVAMWPFFDGYKNPSKYVTYIAGDSQELRDIADKRYGDQTYQVPGKIAHISRKNYTMVNMTKQEASVIQKAAMTKVVLEQNILQRCDTMLITRSGFNLMAIYQRNHSENLYCMVKGIVLPCIRELVFNIFILF